MVGSMGGWWMALEPGWIPIPQAGHGPSGAVFLVGGDVLPQSPPHEGHEESDRVFCNLSGPDSGGQEVEGTGFGCRNPPGAHGLKEKVLDASQLHEIRRLDIPEVGTKKTVPGATTRLQGPSSFPIANPSRSFRRRFLVFTFGRRFLVFYWGCKLTE
jgi:hypothetical protein